MFGGIVDRVAGALGYRVLRTEHLRQTQGVMGWEYLAELPIRPKTVIDIGVADGTPELYAAFPDANLILVEPLAEFFPTINQLLSSRRGQHLPFAAGDRTDELPMTVETVAGAKSSFLPRTELTATNLPSAVRTIPVRPLDELLTAVDLVGPILLKVDVEGFEMSVFRGAPRTLQRVDMVIVEASVAPRFISGDTYLDVAMLLKEHGLLLHDVVHIARAKDVGIRHADLVFRRTP